MEFQVIYILIGILMGSMSEIVFKHTNEFFAKHDGNKIVVTHKLLAMYAALMFGLNVALLVKYGFSVTYWCLAYLLVYLSICAYIDYKTQMVYTILSLFAGIIGGFYYIYTIFRYDTLEHLSGVDLVIFIVIMSIAKKRELFGAGDWDVFMVIAIYVCALPQETFPIERVLLIMLLSMGVQFILGFKKIDFPHFRLREPMALVPAIFVSTIINLLC